MDVARDRLYGLLKRDLFHFTQQLFTSLKPIFFWHHCLGKSEKKQFTLNFSVELENAMLSFVWDWRWDFLWFVGRCWLVLNDQIVVYRQHHLEDFRNEESQALHLLFNTIPRWIIYTVKFEKHWLGCLSLKPTQINSSGIGHRKEN